MSAPVDGHGDRDSGGDAGDTAPDPMPAGAAYGAGPGADPAFPPGPAFVAPELPPSLGATIAANVTTWIGIIGAAIAAIQTGTTAISGHYSEKAAEIQADKTLELQKLKDSSDLAKTYLDMILSAETSPQDRTLLYDALSNIQGHPLQAWAKMRYESNRKFVEELLKNAQAQASAELIKEEQLRESEKLRLQAESISLEMAKARDDGDVAKVEELRASILVIYAEKSSVDARVAVVTAQISVVAPSADPSRQTPQAEIVAKLPETVNVGSAPDALALSLKLTPERLYPIFAPAAKPNIDANLTYLQKALQEFQVSDPRMVAYVVANLASESPGLTEWAEDVEFAKAHYDASTSMGRTLGNTEPGDAVLYRGRGYFGITGKANYARFGQKLGLPSLASFPEDAKKPAVAFRIGLAIIEERSDRIMAALDSDGIVDASRVTIGAKLSDARAAKIKQNYERILAFLTS